MQKYDVLLYSFSLFYFEFEGNFTSTSPQGLIFGGAIYRKGFCVTLFFFYIRMLFFRPGLNILIFLPILD